MRWNMAGLVVPALLWCAASAAAEPGAREGFRLERFAPAATPQDGFALTLPSTLGHLRWASTVSLGYVLNPFKFRGPPEQRFVAQRMTADLTFAIGLRDELELYARAPFVLVGAGDDAYVERTRLDAPGGFAMGDAALGGTADIYHFRALRLGARAELLLPTGSQPELTGDYALAPRGHVLASYEIWHLTFGLEAGAVYRPDRDYALVRIGSEYEWVAGARYALRESFEVWLEGFGTRAARRPKEASALDTLDLLLGARHRAPVGALCLYSSGAIGTGFSDAAGDPDLRVLFNVALVSEKAAETSRTRAHDAFSDGSQPAPEKD